MIHKTTRSILSVLLAVLLLIASIPLTPAFADGGAVSPQSESAEGRVLDGDGTKDNPYKIATAADLLEFADKVNNKNQTSAWAELTANIDLNNQPWYPIGDKEYSPYTGTFNGDGHTISGLNIDSSTADYQGLFGSVGSSGKIENLSVSGSVKGDNYVGGIVGYNSFGTVTNCAFTGNVSGNSSVGGVVGYNGTGGSVTNCYNTGDVTGGSNVGGVVGDNRGGSVTNSYNTGSVSGPDSGSNVGGVVGYNYLGASVENCYNTGTVTGPVSASGNNSVRVGGVVGYNNSSGNVTNCYNTGTVTGPDSGSDSNVGGVVGENRGSVENCYNTGTVTGTGDYVGGVVGYNSSSGTVTDCYFLKQNGVPAQGIGSDEGAEGAAAVKDLSELYEKFASDPWTTSPFCEHPVLKANPEGGLGTATHPYEIKTAAQLETFRDIVNGEGGNPNPNAHAKLMNNIDLKGSETKPWTPIGNSYNNAYTGTFNGQNFKISGLYIDDSTANYKGLFGRVNGGTVQDLTVSGSVKGDDYVGGVVGYNYSGIVTGCIFSGSGSVSGVTGGNYVGGVVGQNSSRGTVENCYNTGSVNGSADSSSVGGVVGDNSGTVKNCYNTDAVSGSGWYVGGVVGRNSGTVENCYNTDKVSGNRSVGGVVGWNDSGTVKNCYNTGSVTGSSDYVGGVVGQNFGSGSVTNCYFLKTDDVNKDLPGIGGGSGTSSNVEARTDDTFHSGEVAYLLQSKQTTPVWGQNIKDGEKDNYPQLRAFDADTPQVYKVAFMNDSEEHDAKYANSGMTVTPPEAPNKTDHLFGGWFNNGELTGDPVTGPISVTGNATYTAKWTPFSYTLSATPDTLNFGSITEGEERPAAQTVTVKNTGNQTVTLNQPTATNFEITTSDNLTLNAGESVTLTIQPKANLSRGSYSEQIAISNTNGEKATITATFTVKEPPYTGKYSYEIATDIGDNGSLTVDRYATEGDKVTIEVTPDQAYKLDDLSVTANGKDVELTANGDGTYTFTMPSADVKITATFAEDPDWTPDEPEEPTTDVSDLFIDVAPNAWYKDAIQYAYDNGLMTGVSANEFAPEQTTTRAMIVSILARLEGVTTAEAAGFADVNDEWYATAVNWAANVGVVNGYEDNTFQPNTAITREQLAAILMNYAAYKGEDVSNRADLATYTDQPSTWAQEAMQWAVAEGLISGVTNDQLQPQSSATRAQVAAILQRYLEA